LQPLLAGGILLLQLHVAYLVAERVRGLAVSRAPSAPLFSLAASPEPAPTGMLAAPVAPGYHIHVFPTRGPLYSGGVLIRNEHNQTE